MGPVHAGSDPSARYEVSVTTDADDASISPRISTVPVLSVRPGDSPRLAGVDKAHVARLAETEGSLPPILVERRSMRVIDGMHRLMVASLRGQETINVEFFDGSEAEAFLRAVEANVKHGLPLTQEDRRAAAARILVLHPQMSDRSIAKLAGLATRTVAAIRRYKGSSILQSDIRVGKDGKARPINGAEGRRRAAATIMDNPHVSLREIARIAGVSPATARDVRRRLELGQEPVTSQSGGIKSASLRAPGSAAEPAPRARQPAVKGARVVQSSVEILLAKLLQDPSMRHKEQGRRLLRVLQANAIGTRELSDLVAALPPHCVATVAQIARQNAQMWGCLVRELEERAQVIDPKAYGWRLMGCLSGA